MAARRTLYLAILSADNITKDVFSLFNPTKSYVVVSLSDYYQYGSPGYKTTVNKTPRWDVTKEFRLTEAGLQNNQITIRFRIFSRHTFLPDSLLGEVHVSAYDLFSSVGKKKATAGFTLVSHEIRKKSSKKPKGVFNFWYKFGKVFTPVSSPPYQKKEVSSSSNSGTSSSSSNGSGLLTSLAVMTSLIS